MKIETGYHSFEELMLDFDIFGTLVSEPQIPVEEYKEMLWADYRKTHLVTLEAQRYKVGDIVRSDYDVHYYKSLSLGEDESEIDLSLTDDEDFQEDSSSDSKSYLYEQEIAEKFTEWVNIHNQPQQVTTVTTQESVDNTEDIFEDLPVLPDDKKSQVEDNFGTTEVGSEVNTVKGIVEDSEEVEFFTDEVKEYSEEQIDDEDDEDEDWEVESEGETTDEEDEDDWGVESEDGTIDEEDEEDEEDDWGVESEDEMTDEDNEEAEEDGWSTVEDDEDGWSNDGGVDTEQSQVEPSGSAVSTQTTQEVTQSTAPVESAFSNKGITSSQIPISVPAPPILSQSTPTVKEKTSEPVAKKKKKPKRVGESKSNKPTHKTSNSSGSTVQKTQMLKSQVEKSVPQQVSVIEEPKDIREFLRKYPHSDIDFVLKYFTRKDIQSALAKGRVIKKGNKLHI